MSKATGGSRPRLRKIKPTLFPLGFAVARVEDNLVIVDFLDELDGQTTILESIALPKTKAIQLSNALKSAIEEEDETAQE